MTWWSNAMMRIFAPRALRVRKQMDERVSPDHVHEYKYYDNYSPFKRCSCGLETLEVDWLHDDKKE